MLTILLLFSTHAFGAPIAATDSARIEALFDSYFHEVLALSPESGAQLGLPKQSGYPVNKTALDDISDSGIQANLGLAHKYLDRFKQIDKTKITRSQELDAQLLTWLLQLQVEGEPFIYHGYQISQLSGVLAQVVNLMTSLQTIADGQDAEDYVARLEKIQVKVRQAEAIVRKQEGQGIRPPNFIIATTIGAVREFLTPDPKANVFYTDFAFKLGPLSNVDPATQERLRDRAAMIIKDQIYPAFDSYLKALNVSLEHSDSLAGVWKLPNGDKYYRYCLKSNTTLSLAPETVFQMGIDEVKSLQDQAKRLLDSVGVRGDKSYGALMQDYWDLCKTPELKQRLNYPDDPSSAEQIVADYQAYVDSARARMPEAFAYILKTPVLVRRVPAYKEQSGLTYYEPASLDGLRPATFYINLAHYPGKAGMRSLTYHETIPGHHYQIALQQELTQTRMFKNLCFLSGFGEGWAMYVQNLAAELGWLPDTYSRISELNSQLFRAVRVVVDAGIHYKRWSKPRALDYMEQNLGWSSESEIDRYIVWPGQACSYTIGKLKIKELRTRAMKELGPKFDLKAFHTTVLENGSVPLEMLEKIVDEFIAKRKG
jgi:uncharacterized protein (DUF885 family)